MDRERGRPQTDPLPKKAGKAIKAPAPRQLGLAVIYCRVSDRKQDLDGNGLHSQEHRCREYAASRAYSVEAVFHDVKSAGMKARVERGFWPFKVPIGYRFTKGEGGGRVLVRDEPMP